jgi:hypothetical protein
VIVDEPAGVDLWYWELYLDEETLLPSDEELAQAEHEAKRFARTDDLWVDG